MDCLIRGSSAKLAFRLKGACSLMKLVIQRPQDYFSPKLDFDVSRKKQFDICAFGLCEGWTCGNERV
jgi:hypothetical protein